jgi:hypothetical protein
MPAPVLFLTAMMGGFEKCRHAADSEYSENYRGVGTETESEYEGCANHAQK